MDLKLTIEIKNVGADKIRPLRHAELRKGQDFSTTSYLRDNEPNTFHMASILDNKTVACATFYPEKTDKILAKNAYRLRGVATDINYRRKGCAKELMRASFLDLKSKGADFVWCNARLAALGFYKSIGFKIKGDLFDIDLIGPHYYMYKAI